MSEKLSKILNWMEDFKNKNNVKGVVLGLSGGKDSTVVAMLSKLVFGENVVAVMMPNGIQPDLYDSLDIAQTLGVKWSTVNIMEAFDDLINEIEIDNPTVTEKAKTNIAPRLRMTTLYAIAQTLGYMVIGTGNLSEGTIGWCTKWGDAACDFNPIGNLTCAEVIEIGLELAKELGLNEKYIVKKPSDGLTMKSDEDNFGFTYKELDDYILYGTEGTNIDKIKNMIKWASHKKSLPPKPEKII